MNIDERISHLEKSYPELSKPPVEIAHSYVELVTANCPAHGAYEQRTRLSIGIVKIPSVPSPCPHCLRDEMASLKGQKHELARMQGCERLRGSRPICRSPSDSLNVPSKTTCPTAKKLSVP